MLVKERVWPLLSALLHGSGLFIACFSFTRKSVSETGGPWSFNSWGGRRGYRYITTVGTSIPVGSWPCYVPVFCHLDKAENITFIDIYTEKVIRLTEHQPKYIQMLNVDRQQFISSGTDKAVNLCHLISHNQPFIVLPCSHIQLSFNAHTNPLLSGSFVFKAWQAEGCTLAAQLVAASQKE